MVKPDYEKIALDLYQHIVHGLPEPPDHSCTSGITPCDGLCVDYANFWKWMDEVKETLYPRELIK